jgi:glutamate racemase
MGDQVTLVSSAEETAKDVYRTLTAHKLMRTSATPPSLRVQATGDAKPFGRLARRFLGPEVTQVEHLDTANPAAAGLNTAYPVTQTVNIQQISPN